MKGLMFAVFMFLTVVSLIWTVPGKQPLRRPAMVNLPIIIQTDNPKVVITVSKDEDGRINFAAFDYEVKKYVHKFFFPIGVKILGVHYDTSATQYEHLEKELQEFGIARYLPADTLNVPLQKRGTVVIIQTSSNLYLFDSQLSKTFAMVDLDVPGEFIRSVAIAYDPNNRAIISTNSQEGPGKPIVGQTSVYKFEKNPASNWFIGSPTLGLQQGAPVAAISVDNLAAAPPTPTNTVLKMEDGSNYELQLNIHDGVILQRQGKEGSPKPFEGSGASQKLSESNANASSESVARGHRTNHEDYVAAFRKMMNELVIGQPEAVEAMVDVETQSIVEDNESTEPSVVMLMGLPGTGKDTTAESYIKTRFALLRGNRNVRVDDHLYRLPQVKSENDVWKLTGSATGYTGSGKISSLNRFLVMHSGGKYRIVEENSGFQGKKEFIEMNPDWKPGQVLEGYFAPEDGVVFVNEFHDWSKDMKNRILKESFEKGYFEIGNPGQGANAVHRLQVPIRFIVASNDGIDLIIPRDKDGNRIGAPLGYKDLMEHWKSAYKKVDTLLKEIKKASPSNPVGGTSAEIVDRLPKSRIVLMRPMSPETIKLVAVSLLNKIKATYGRVKGNGFPSVNLEFTPELVNFLATYDQLPEDGARTLKDKIDSLVSKTLRDSLLSGAIKKVEDASYKIGVVDNKDGTFSLDIGGQKVLMHYTEKGRHNQPLTDAEIDELNQIEKKLNEKVQGLEHIVRRIARDLRKSANSQKPERPELNKKPADVYAFLGVSSTGKTELAKAIHQVRFNTESDPLILDFGQVKSAEDIKTKILGTKVGDTPVASDFMRSYDRSNGQLVVVLDEITNADPHLLPALYDILREPVVQTFSDGVPRSMDQVIVIMTGNAGEEWYKDIPRNLPEWKQLEAARQIYEEAEANSGFRRHFLLSKFTEAFLNRVGDERTFFFAPHTAKTTRQLIQAKLISFMQRFSKPDPSKRTWDVKFRSEEDYKKTIESIEEYGFKLWEQGASITRFINDVFLGEIHDQLLREKIPNGAKVTIVKVDNKITSSASKVRFQLLVAGRTTPLELELDGKVVPRELKRTEPEIRMTTHHEIGHELVRHVLLGDKIAAGGVTILPGVSAIGGNMVSYEGLANSVQYESYSLTRETILANIAVMMGGEAGEQLTTKGERHTGGKSNDIQRATMLAQKAILELGMSEKWGRTAMAEGQDVDRYIAGLSSARKSVLEREVQKLLEEGRALARKVIIANYDDLYLPQVVHLAAKGEISGPVLERFYQQRRNLVVHPQDVQTVTSRVKAFEKRISAESPPINQRDFEFYSFVKKPNVVIDVEALRKQRRQAEIASVDLSQGKVLIDSKPTTNTRATKAPGPQTPKAQKALTCEAYLR